MQGYAGLDGWADAVNGRLAAEWAGGDIHRREKNKNTFLQNYIFCFFAKNCFRKIPFFLCFFFFFFTEKSKKNWLRLVDWRCWRCWRSLHARRRPDLFLRTATPRSA